MSPPPDSEIRLLIVDDHAMFREGLARVIEKHPGLRIAGQCGSASEALAAIEACGATVVLLDVDLGAERAIDFVLGARQSGFGGRILVVTAGVGDQEAIRLIEAGVAGIVHKQQSTDVLCSAIRQVAAGEVWLEKTYLGGLFRSVDRSRPAARARLTERDRTVLRLIFQGLTNREIAGRLDVTEGAIKSSLRHLCGKLGVRTRAQLVKVALEQYREQL